MKPHSATKKALTSAIKAKTAELIPYLLAAKERGLNVVIATADVEVPNATAQPIYVSITEKTDS